MKNTAKAETPKFFKILQLVGIVGLTLLVVNFIYQMMHRNTNSTQQTVNTLCDLQTGPCGKVLPNNATLQLELSPRPIQANTPLNIEVKLTNMTPKQVSLILFPVPATNPTTNPIMLTAQQNGEYVGQATITKTGTANQSWVAMVNINLGEQQISAPFKFQIQ